MNTFLNYLIIIISVLNLALLFNYLKIIKRGKKINQLEKNIEFLIRKIELRKNRTKITGFKKD